MHMAVDAIKSRRRLEEEFEDPCLLISDGITCCHHLAPSEPQALARSFLEPIKVPILEQGLVSPCKSCCQQLSRFLLTLTLRNYEESMNERDVI